MDGSSVTSLTEFLLSPFAAALLTTLATALLWIAFRPTPAAKGITQRLGGYLQGEDVIEVVEIDLPFRQRVLTPMFRRLLRLFSRVAPKRNIEETERRLVQAGSPGNLSALDFFGLQILLVVVLGGGYFFLVGSSLNTGMVLRNALFLALVGYFLPVYWLRRKVRSRKHQALRSLPDALDMMTIGVESGLAFETAMLKVGEKWDNALTRELRRAVFEMRVGTPRNVALERMAERLGVDEVSSFVTVLIQSTQLGMSIAQVLHRQADEMRVKRRQRAEELARKAGGKMIFPLVLCFIPSLFIVILGPVIPNLVEAAQNFGGSVRTAAGKSPKTGFRWNASIDTLSSFELVLDHREE